MGHGEHESPTLDVDYGHVLSFYQRLKDMIDKFDLNQNDHTSNKKDGKASNKPDLYFVMNGDFIHGTFLGADPPHYLSGIIEKMPYDIVTIGDHELTNADSLAVLREPGGLIDEWGDRLITSNVRVDDSSASSSQVVPLGQKYKILNGNQGAVLVLGFLYNMGNEAVVTVEKVEDVLQQPWFTSLFTDSSSITTNEERAFDVILVMAHMDVQDELVTLLHTTLRQYVGSDMTIQFITGHTHIRAHNMLDQYSSSFEAGRYLDTVGYLSFDPQTANSTMGSFINANQRSLAQSLGVEENAYSTKDGLALSDYIQRTLDHSGANEVVGCSDGRYRADGYLNETDSLMRLYLERVLPSYLNKQDAKKGTHSHGKKTEAHIFVQYLESVRFDLFPSVVTMNDIYTAVPQDGAIVKIGHSIPGHAILNIVQQMNVGNATNNVVGVAMESSEPSSQVKPPSMLLPPYGVQNESIYTLHTLSQNVVAMQDAMIKLNVPAILTSSTKTTQSMRSLWIDFVKREWAYDGNDCQCLQDEDGCQINTNYTVASSGGKSEAGSSTAAEDHGGAAHITDTSSSKGSHPTTKNQGGATHIANTPASKGSHSGSKESNGASNWTVFWVTIVACAVFFSIMLRRSRRRGYSTPPVRRSELDGSNDLELQEYPPAASGAYGVSAGGGYSSPAMRSTVV